MNPKIIVLQRASEEQIDEFISDGVLYSDKTYNIEALVKMGFKAMKNNIHGTAKKHGLTVQKDIMGRSSLTGAQLGRWLRKKTGLSD